MYIYTITCLYRPKNGNLFFFSGWDEVLEKIEKLNYFRWHHPFEVSNGFPLEIDSMQKLIKTRKMGARNGGTQWAHQVGLLSGSASRPLRAFSGESIWIRVPDQHGICGRLDDSRACAARGLTKQYHESHSWCSPVVVPSLGFNCPILGWSHRPMMPMTATSPQLLLSLTLALVDSNAYVVGSVKQAISKNMRSEVNFITQFLKGHLFQEIWSTINLLQEYVLCPEMAIFEDKSWQTTGVFEVPKGPLWSFG